MTKQHMYIPVSNDLGNGHTKITVGGTTITEPSIIAKQRKQDLVPPVRFSSEHEQHEYMRNLLNHMDVSIQSPTVSTSERLLVGVSAFRLPQSVEGFDVNDFEGKSEMDLPLIITLSTIAGYAVVQDFKRTQEIPTHVDVISDMTVALPINEGKRNGAINQYSRRYKDNTHHVTFHNFDELITVTIRFRHVEVALEGEAAQLKLKHAPKDLAEAVKADFDKFYPELAQDPNFTAQDLVTFPNVMGIDIGEGTTDLPVFVNGQINEQASTSLPEGYGNALEEALTDLRNNNMNFNSRNELQEYVMTPPTKLDASRKQIAQKAVMEQLDLFAKHIVDGVSTNLRKNATNISAIFVYGGGATPMRYYLRELLMKKTQSFTQGIGIPVIFVPETYAQILNERGLGLILDLVLTNLPKIDTVVEGGVVHV